jgi:hypothetical protein
MLKPLRVAPLTDEDWAIWWTRPGLAMRMQSRKGCALWNWANNGDRGDAELMLLAKLNPHYDVLINVHGGRELLIRWGSTARMLGVRYTSSNSAQI